MNYVNNLLGEGQSQTEFFTNPTVIDAYKNYKSQIISRYEDSPAIFAWELANEVLFSERLFLGSKLLMIFRPDAKNLTVPAES